MLDLNPKRSFNRAIFVMLGVVAIGLGFSTLRHGNLFYQNWWGGTVFGPLVMFFGVLFVLLAIFKPEIFKA